MACKSENLSLQACHVSSSGGHSVWERHLPNKSKWNQGVWRTFSEVRWGLRICFSDAWMLLEVMEQRWCLWCTHYRYPLHFACWNTSHERRFSWRMMHCLYWWRVLASGFQLDASKQFWPCLVHFPGIKQKQLCLGGMSPAWSCQGPAEWGKEQRLGPKYESQAEGLPNKVSLCSFPHHSCSQQTDARLHGSSVTELTLDRGNQTLRKVQSLSVPSGP